MLKVGVAGGSGYGGVELIQILLRHPEVEITFLSSEQYSGRTVESLFPHLRGFLDLTFSPLESWRQTAMDVLFLALPHGAAMKLVPQLPEDLLVIDLSGDFRISDPAVFETYYGFPLASVDLQRQFVYGLTEINRDRIAGARRIANPGCFATATLLALYPLYREGWIDGPVFVDSKTGSSGAGRTPSATTHHPRRSRGFFPYKAFKHQHIPEMLQMLDRPENPLVFQPHSGPFVRGIFASHYMRTRNRVTSGDIEQLFEAYYGRAPFVRWAGESPDLSSIQHSNFVDLGAACSERFLIVWSALDNLQKGAAGQAVQNMNVACGMEETSGLGIAPAFP